MSKPTTLRVIIQIVLLILTAPAYAKGIHEIGFDTELSKITYTESKLVVDGAVINVKETGIMRGVSGFYAYHNRLFLQEEGRYSWGDVDYSCKGDTCGNIEGKITIKNIPDYSYELRSLIGWEFKYLTPYAGIGYRYLNDNGQGRESSQGIKFYLRESNYLYIPAGLILNNEFKSLKFRITAELDALIGGRQISHLDQIQGFPRVSNKQPTGYGTRGALEIIKNIGAIDFVFSGFVRHWGIQGSKESEGFVEPKNNSNEIGVKIGVRF